MVGAREGHRRHLPPGGARLIHVDDRCARVDRGEREVRIPEGSGLHHSSRRVHHGAATRDEAVADGRPPLSIHVEPPRHGTASAVHDTRSGFEHGSVREDEHECVHRTATGRGRECAPGVRPGVVDFGNIGQPPGRSAGSRGRPTGRGVRTGGTEWRTADSGWWRVGQRATVHAGRLHRGNAADHSRGCHPAC